MDSDADEGGGGCSKDVDVNDGKPSDCDNNKSSECCDETVVERVCDCDAEDRFQLLDTITTYLQSAVSGDELSWGTLEGGKKRVKTFCVENRHACSNFKKTIPTQIWPNMA